MKRDLQTSFRQGQKFAGRIAGIGAAVAVALAWNGLSDLRLAYHFVLFACLAPLVGCTVFTLIHRATGGQWARGLRLFLRTGTSLLPWTWILGLPGLLYLRASALNLPIPPARWAYESLVMLASRGVLVGAVLFGISWACGLEVGNDRSATANRHRWVGPVGLITLVFALTFVADDWIESGQPGWHSTAFPVVWIASQCVTGLALCVLAALVAGTDPQEKGIAGRQLGSDWGNLLLATIFFWTYVSFGEFLIIWSGNLPDEISWYLARERGLWKFVAPLLAVGNFLVPFLCLLSRRFKTSTRGLGGVAAALVAGQILYAAWLVLPAGYPLTIVGALTSAALLVAGAGLLVHQFCRTARRLEGGAR